MSDELECNKPKKLNPGNEPANDTGVGATQQSARTRAGRDAQQEALRKALKEAAEWDCPDDDTPPCTVRQLRIDLHKPSLGTPETTGLFGGPKWKCKASCEWSGTITCVVDPHFAEEQVPLEYQEFTCDDGWVLIAAGDANSLATNVVKAKPPGAAGPALLPEIVEAAEIVGAAAKELAKLTDAFIRRAIFEFHCPERCPDKRIRVWFWPPTLHHGQPDAAGVETWWMTQRYRIEAKCDRPSG